MFSYDLCMLYEEVKSRVSPSPRRSPDHLEDVQRTFPSDRPINSITGDSP